MPVRLALLLIAIFALGCSRKEDQRPVRTEPEPAVLAPPKAKVAVAEPVALVELYTSEGCSSCPPADENLTRIAYAARDSGQRVIALSFHVDYWNYIGWKDPFSAAQYSERQRRYAKRLGSGVYTPQMVVAGREQFLGSREGKADAAIERALARPSTHAVSMSAKGASKIGFEVIGPAGDVVVHVAVAQGAGGVKVKRGENAGRTLSHVNIVRALSSKRTRAPGGGQLTLDIPAAVDKRSAMVVAWVEGAESGHVLGAAARSGLLASTSQ